MAAAASRSVVSLTSNGTKRVSVPADCNASRSNLVFSDVPEPSSTNVSAFVTCAISSDLVARIERSVRVG